MSEDWYIVMAWEALKRLEVERQHRFRQELLKFMGEDKVNIQSLSLLPSGHTNIRASVELSQPPDGFHAELERRAPRQGDWYVNTEGNYSQALHNELRQEQWCLVAKSVTHPFRTGWIVRKGSPGCVLDG